MKNKLIASDFMNYLYCPRIIYYTHILKLPQTKSIKQKKGMEKDFAFKNTKRTQIIKKYWFSLIKKYNLSLENEEFATKIDCIAIDKENNLAFPIQLKYSLEPKKVYRSQKFQLMLEALLIENTLNYKVLYGYIKYIRSNTLKKVWLIDKSQIFKIAEKIKDIIKNEKFPKATIYKKRCIDCCYRRMC